MAVKVIGIPLAFTQYHYMQREEREKVNIGRKIEIEASHAELDAALNDGYAVVSSSAVQHAEGTTLYLVLHKPPRGEALMDIKAEQILRDIEELFGEQS